ncbi:helix-turn-helix domain-containing protein [Actinospica sp. MGRD01-02]|uniref:Helix-turn-helix domain-containing protein n=1 Tax=Actinospica acidithermotolerans TaxID=2828514 RepID=A0A941E658_9ACTN|nr:helix-turn-helix domain-containing protein [Actinospica acidithermotolerans]
MVARLKPLTPDSSAVHRFGAVLRHLRIEAGLSQPELAAKIYTSKSTLSRAETGVRLLPRDLAEACDTLFSANGVLTSTWRRADSGCATKAQRIQRGNASGLCVGSLCSFALRTRCAQDLASGGSLTVQANRHAASNSIHGCADFVWRRDSRRTIAPGRTLPAWHRLSLAGRVLSDPRSRSRLPAGLRPGARGRPTCTLARDVRTGSSARVAAGIAGRAAGRV